MTNLIGARIQGPAGGARALTGRPRAPIRFQGPADGLGDRDRRTSRFSRGADPGRREARPLPLEFFTDPFQARRRRADSPGGNNNVGEKSSTPTSASPAVGSPPFASSGRRPRVKPGCSVERSHSRANISSKTRLRPRRAIRRRVRSRRSSRARLAEIMESRTLHSRPQCGRVQWHLGSGVPTAGARRRADQSQGGRRPSAFRSGARVVPHPDLGGDAAGALRGSDGDEQAPCRAARQQFCVRPLLMPSTVLDRFGDWSTFLDAALPDRLDAVADELRGDSHSAEMATCRSGPT